MPIHRASAFAESPEELLHRALNWTVESHNPVDNQMLIRDLGKALEKERSDRATSASIIRSQNLDYGALEKKVIRSKWLQVGLVFLAISNLIAALILWSRAVR